MSQRGSQTVNSVERKCVYCTSVSVWCVRAFAVRLREDLCVLVVWQSHGIGHNPCSCIYRVLHQVRSHSHVPLYVDVCGLTFCFYRASLINEWSVFIR